MIECNAKSHKISLSAGIELNYLEAGSGQTLVMVPGWSQTANEYLYQINDLQKDYHIIAIDMRGHGKSSKPASGYRISRLAFDLHEALIALNLKDVVLLGHSMGCAVIYSYWELFGPDRIKKLILVDQPCAITANPAWSREEQLQAGSIFTPLSLYDTANALVDSIPTNETLLKSMFTDKVSSKDMAWIAEENYKMPRKFARDLLINHAMNDWRELIKTINIPSLLIGGEVSIFPYQAVKWNSEQISGSVFVLFTEEDRGSHFMFFENPERFNSLIRNFLK
jgi:pimeloyl-ACP methyl ester carboxylesterase